MKIIYLKNVNRFCYVDDDDYERFGQMKWRMHKRGYVVRDTSIDGKRHWWKLHRLVLDAQCGQLVDHINGTLLDNRKVNLRICDHAGNAQNIKLSVKNTSGFKGVYFIPASKNWNVDKWKAQIAVNGKRIGLGYFDTPEEASEAYIAAALKYHQKFARHSSFRRHP